MSMAGATRLLIGLRVDPAPFATALFPLGGPKGQTIEVEVSGGNLAGPRKKSITLPDAPGSSVDPGEFDGPGGPALSPARLVVGDGPEVIEPMHRGRRVGDRRDDRSHHQRPDRPAGRGRPLSAEGQGGREGPVPDPGEFDGLVARLGPDAPGRERGDLAENDDSNNAFPPTRPGPSTRSGSPSDRPTARSTTRRSRRRPDAGGRRPLRRRRPRIRLPPGHRPDPARLRGDAPAGQRQPERPGDRQPRPGQDGPDVAGPVRRLQPQAGELDPDQLPDRARRPAGIRSRSASKACPKG